MRAKYRRKFDPILKNVFVNSLGIILQLAGIPPKEVRKLKLLPTEIHITKTLRIDLLTETPSYIIQIEIQNFPDPRLPRRMFVYYVSIDLWQEREVEQKRRNRTKQIIQIVIWLGSGKPPPAQYRTTTTVHRYHVIDIRKIPPDVFLRSDNPYEVLLALLAGRSVVKHKKRKGKQMWTKEILQKVIGRLQELTKTEKELLKYIEEIEILGTLFDLDVGAKEMIKGEIDITKTSLFQEGRKEGEKIGLRKGEKLGKREGRKEELKHAILLAVQIKFGKDKAKFTSRKIKAVDNIKKLRKIYTSALKSQSWREFSSSLNSDHQ